MAFFVSFSRAGSGAGVAVAIAVAVSPFGFDSFIKINQEARNPGSPEPDGQSAFLGFMVSRFKSFLFPLPFLSDTLRHDFLQVFHIFWRSIMMLYVGAFTRDVSRKE